MQVGFGRADVSVYDPDLCMMGWGQPTQKPRGVGVPLYARALWLDDGEGPVVYVVVDLMAIPQGVVADVLARLSEGPGPSVDPTRLSIAATHTHSGPSGFGHHLWLQLVGPGWSALVHDGVVDGIVAAIRAAHADRRGSQLTLHTGTLPLQAGLAWNRSWFAYRRNPEVTPVPRARRDEATDRTMTVLAVRDGQGEVTGLVSWLGLHGTTVHADNTLLHPDHKGLAASAFEARGVSAIFAQECCGDVSPNHRLDAQRGHTVGDSDDDLANAQQVADAQVALVEALLAEPGTPVDGPLRMHTTWTDLSCAPAAAAFTPDGHGHLTRPAVVGLAMAEGTAEGRGPLWLIRRPIHWAHTVRRGIDRLWGALGGVRTHDPKLPLADLGHGPRARFVGVIPLGWMPALDPALRWARRVVRHQGDTAVWLPHEIPTQLLQIGPLLVCTTPFEVTTVAGRRLRQTLAEAAPTEVEHVVVSTYANAYVGYLTTYEEYQLQHYEAAYTLFGPFTLAAVQTVAARMAERLSAGEASLGRLPAAVPHGVLGERLHALAR